MTTEIYKKQKLDIVHINVNSIISIARRYELKQFLTDYKPDILLMNETKLNKRHKLEFPEYNLIRNDRKGATQGGGTAILIKNGIKHLNFTSKTIKKLTYLETCVIRIPMTNNTFLFIISAYYPAGNNESRITAELDELFNSLELQNLNHYYILAGDLNSKHTNWKNACNNQKGCKLKDWLLDKEIPFKCKMYASVLPSFPRTNSFLDICIADCRLHFETENNTLNCLKNIDYDSDHTALQLKVSLNLNTEFTFISSNPHIKYNFKKTNWKTFQKTLSDLVESQIQIPNNVNLPNNIIDEYLVKINEIISLTIDKVTPKQKAQNSLNRLTNKIIKKLHAEKSKLLTLIKKHYRLEHTIPLSTLNLAKVKLKLVRKLLHENINKELNSKLEESLTSISPKEPKHMFAQIKCNFKKFEPLQLNEIKLPEVSKSIIDNANIDADSLDRDQFNNFIITDETEMLDGIGSYLETIHSEKTININNAVHKNVNDFFANFKVSKHQYETNKTVITTFSNEKPSDNPTDTEMQANFTTSETLSSIFRNLKGKMSFGIDGIPNIILKYIPELLINQYCKLFNNMINNSYFPQFWKEAKVVIVPKKDKDTSNPKNLRPISLLPNISKVFEMCVNNIILKTCDEKKLANEKQFGFKYRHSTINAIHLLTSSINWNWQKGLCTGACLIDIEKAFDTVWIPGLLFKLNQYGFPFHHIILIYNMISNKTFKVTHGNRYSKKCYKMCNGLQQGTVNAPVLFNLYISDLINQIENMIAFADDMIIYYADKSIEAITENVQNMYDLIENYTADWNININPQKCETILFRPSVAKCNSNIKRKWKMFSIKSKMKNTTIPNKQIVKYLGVHLDKFLYYNEHVKKSLINARNAFFNYKNLFYSKYVQTRVKIIMYKSLIRPIIVYGCPIWFNISPSYMEKLRKFERQCLRVCTKMYRSPESGFKKYISNEKLYNKANITRIDNFIINIIRNHILRSTANDDNNLIMAPYFQSDQYISTTLESGFVPPEAFIYMDSKGLVQDANGIPILYHRYRRANEKGITYSNESTDLRFSTKIAQSDLVERNKLKKFWWLES